MSSELDNDLREIGRLQVSHFQTRKISEVSNNTPVLD